MYIVTIGGEWPLAVGYDIDGDPTGYTYDTLDQAQWAADIHHGQFPGWSKPVIYKLTAVDDDEDLPIGNSECL